MAQGDAFTPGDGLRNIEVLYVDGEAHRRDLMRRLLLGMGAGRVQLAESAESALQVLDGSSPALVLGEIHLVKMDGIGLVRKIRAVENYPRALVPALLITDPVGPEIIMAAMEAGANHVLVKPVSAAKLYERIQWALADLRPFAIRNGHYVRTRGAPPLTAGGAA